MEIFDGLDLFSKSYSLDGALKRKNASKRQFETPAQIIIFWISGLRFLDEF